MDYLKAFLVGGAICMLGQLLIDKTRLTPARILVCYVVLGVILGGAGVYDKLVDFAGAGATVPLTGFGNTLAKGVREAVKEERTSYPCGCAAIHTFRRLIMSKQNKTNKTESQNTSNQTQNQDSKNCK